MLYDVVLRYGLQRTDGSGNDLNTWLMKSPPSSASIAYAMSTVATSHVDLLYDLRTRPARSAYFDLVGLTRDHPADGRLGHARGLYDHFMTALQTGKSVRARAASTRSSGRSSWGPVCRLCIFTLQIVAEIIKRASSLMGQPFDDRGETGGRAGVQRRSSAPAGREEASDERALDVPGPHRGDPDVGSRWRSP